MLYFSLHFSKLYEKDMSTPAPTTTFGAGMAPPPLRGCKYICGGN